MRSHGTRLELVGMQPSDHIGWIFSGPSQFAALARRFLAEGVSRGEQLMYVTEEPDPGGPEGLGEQLPPDVLQVTTIAEVYGPSGVVDPAQQRATFAAALAAATAAGFTGIRVAADNTPLVADDRRFQAWMSWEMAADQFMAGNAVTGLCAFDGGRVPVDRLRHLACLHPLASAALPAPQFRMFADEETVHVEGVVDSSAVRLIARALRMAPGGGKLHLDLRAVTLLSGATVRDLDRLAQAGVAVTISDEADLPNLPGDRSAAPHVDFVRS